MRLRLGELFEEEAELDDAGVGNDDRWGERRVDAEVFEHHVDRSGYLHLIADEACRDRCVHLLGSAL